jgi:hypothetical protein
METAFFMPCPFARDLPPNFIVFMLFKYWT